MTAKLCRWFPSVVLLFSSVLTAPLHLPAQDSQSSARAVRLSSVDGQVQLQQGDQTLADHAVANTPLFEGTQVKTGQDGRAEVQFEDGSVARIAPDSALTLSVLQPGGKTELQLESGMGYFELQGGTGDETMQVKFGSNVATPSGFTVVRIKLDQAPGELAVFSGNLHLEGEAAAEADLHGGQSLTLDADSGQYNVADSIEPDSWDTWNSDRDQALTAQQAKSSAATSQYPDGNSPAWADLNANGTWYDVPEEGNVWSPNEAADPGWDPYGQGDWMYTPQYGYVWISGYPWGFMPYQCGAWNYYNSFGWGWAPGLCQTWWGGGGGGWNWNVPHPPKWYRLPTRPGPPRPHDPHPVQRVHSVGPRPMIPVHRRPQPGAPSLPSRNSDSPVRMGSVEAQPLPIIITRPRYTPGSASPRVNGSQPGGVAPRSGYVRAPQMGTPPPSSGIQQPRPGDGAPRPVFGPPPAFNRPAPSAPRSAPAIRPQPSGGGRMTPAPAPRMAPAPAPRAAPPPAARPAPSVPHK